MDPIDKKHTYNYPNSDRNTGDINQTQSERPLVHLSDVVNNSTENTVEYKTSSVHTFKDDLANEASKGSFSLGKIVEANNKKIYSGEDKSVTIEAKKRHTGLKFVIFIICLLIIFGFSYIGYEFAKTPQEISMINNPSQRVVGNMLYSEISFPLTVNEKNRSSISQEILKESSVTFSTGKIKSFILNNTNGTNTEAISAPEFLNIIAPGVPDLLLRNIKDEYVFGYYAYASNEPFIILKSSNYDSVFAGMLKWEINMYADLNDLIFKQENNTNSEVTNQSTSTSSTTPNKPQENRQMTKSEYDTDFVDKVILNNDARVLYRPNGEIAFFYTFFNKDTVIITVSEQALREIIYRLTSGKINR